MIEYKPYFRLPKEDFLRNVDIYQKNTDSPFSDIAVYSPHSKVVLVDESHSPLLANKIARVLVEYEENTQEGSDVPLFIREMELADRENFLGSFLAHRAKSQNITPAKAIKEWEDFVNKDLDPSCMIVIRGLGYYYKVLSGRAATYIPSTKKYEYIGPGKLFLKEDPYQADALKRPLSPFWIKLTMSGNYELFNRLDNFPNGFSVKDTWLNALLAAQNPDLSEAQQLAILQKAHGEIMKKINW